MKWNFIVNEVIRQKAINSELIILV